MRCPTCKFEVRDGLARCPWCGALLLTATASGGLPATPPPAPPQGAAPPPGDMPPPPPDLAPGRPRLSLRDLEGSVPTPAPDTAPTPLPGVAPALSDDDPSGVLDAPTLMPGLSGSPIEKERSAGEQGDVPPAAGQTLDASEPYDGRTRMPGAGVPPDAAVPPPGAVAAAPSEAGAGVSLDPAPLSVGEPPSLGFDQATGMHLPPPQAPPRGSLRDLGVDAPPPSLDTAPTPVPGAPLTPDGFTQVPDAKVSHIAPPPSALEAGALEPSRVPVPESSSSEPEASGLGVPRLIERPFTDAPELEHAMPSVPDASAIDVVVGPGQQDGAAVDVSGTQGLPAVVQVDVPVPAAEEAAGVGTAPVEPIMADQAGELMTPAYAAQEAQGAGGEVQELADAALPEGIEAASAAVDRGEAREADLVEVHLSPIAGGEQLTAPTIDAAPDGVEAVVAVPVAGEQGSAATNESAPEVVEDALAAAPGKGETPEETMPEAALYPARCESLLPEPPVDGTAPEATAPLSPPIPAVSPAAAEEAQARVDVAPEARLEPPAPPEVAPGPRGEPEPSRPPADGWIVENAQPPAEQVTPADVAEPSVQAPAASTHAVESAAEYPSPAALPVEATPCVASHSGRVDEVAPVDSPLVAPRSSLHELGVEGPPPAVDTAPTPVPNLEPDDMFRALAEAAEPEAGPSAGVEPEQVGSGEGASLAEVLQTTASPWSDPVNRSMDAGPAPEPPAPVPPADEYGMTLGPQPLPGMPSSAATPFDGYAMTIGPTPLPAAPDEYGVTLGPQPVPRPPEEYAMTIGPQAAPAPPRAAAELTMGPSPDDEPSGPPPPPEGPSAQVEALRPAGPAGGVPRRGSLQALMGAPEVPRAAPPRPTPLGQGAPEVPLNGPPPPASGAAVRPIESWEERAGPPAPPASPAGPPPGPAGPIAPPASSAGLQPGAVAQRPGAVMSAREIAAAVPGGVLAQAPAPAAPAAAASPAGTCPHCGARVAGGAAFCMACGRPLGTGAALPAAARAAPAEPYCARCGYRSPGSARFCMRCGAPIAPGGEAAAQAVPARHRHTTGWVVFGVLLVLLAVAAVVLWWLYRSGTLESILGAVLPARGMARILVMPGSG